jgi:DNA topoisomerase 2-associated protein PAT1
MSFFGFEQNDLEREKQKFLEGGTHESEDVAVYTWGEDSYDGLGDALQEGGDELNDETFGGMGNVGMSQLCLYIIRLLIICSMMTGKDFDFSQPALPSNQAAPNRSHSHVEEQITYIDSGPKPPQACMATRIMDPFVILICLL